MKRIVYKFNDITHIVIPCEGNRLANTPNGVVPADTFQRSWPAEIDIDWAESEEEFLKRVADKSIPEGAENIHTVDEDEIPSDRTFRNAWDTDGKQISVDMEKAKDIQRDLLRSLRAPILTKLDVDYIRADEKGETQTKKDIAEQKQALRDVTDDPAIEAATTPEELKQVIPEILWQN